MRALVIGGSVTGLCAAKALAPSFDEVVIIERDALPAASEHRDGVPHDRHLHVLLKRGEQVLEGLFPGLTQDLLAQGAQNIAWGTDMRWMHLGGWKGKHPGLQLQTLFLSRLLLEANIRTRVRTVSKISLRERSVVKELTCEAGVCTGVVIEKRSGGGGEALQADLVVDASGRDSRAPEWLAKAGFSAPKERIVNAHLGYASRLYKRPAQAASFDWRAMLVQPLPPTFRTASIIPIENEQWLVLIAGVNKDYPPNDDQGFLEFAKPIADGAVHELLREAEPASPIWTYRRTENRWRHYEHCRLPERFVSLGDAVCAFNPIYGQGMTNGALGANLLGDLVRSRKKLHGLGPVFQRRLAKLSKMSWLLATSEDGRYPQTEGATPSGAVRLLQRYFDAIARLSVYDEAAYSRFVRTMHLIASPAPLLAPKVFFAALKHLRSTQ